MSAQDAFVCLEGACAAELGRSAAVNPYPPDSAEQRAWSRGYRWYRRLQRARGIKGFTCDDETGPEACAAAAASETPATSTTRPRRVGRGRSKLGPRREWVCDEVARLQELVNQGQSARDIGAALGRSQQAVRNKLTRLRKVAGG